MKYTALILISFFSTISSAETPSLKAIIEKNIIVLDRPLLTFHYRSWNYDPKTQLEARNLVRDAASNFFNADLDKDPNVVGPGFYVSVDPAATRSYGNTEPQLYAVTLKKGLRVLDGRGVDQKELPSLKAAGKELQCFTEKEEYKVNLAGGLRNSSSKQCQAEYMKILKELKVDAILYGYSASSSYANCRVTRDVALNVISADNIAAEDVGFYSDKTRLESRPTGGSFVYQLFEEGRKDPMINQFDDNTRNGAPKATQSSAPLEMAKYEALKAKLIWKCGPVRVSETNEFDKFQEQYKLAQNSGNILAITKEISAAAKARGMFVYVYLPNLRGVLHAQYKLSGMAPDDSKFEQYIKGVMNVHDVGSKPGVTAKTMSDLFEEPVTPMDDSKKEAFMRSFMESVIHSDKNIYQSYQGVLYEALKPYGGGPRMTAAMMNSSLPIPFMIGKVPTNPNKDYSKYILKNRDYVIRFLRKCVEMYKEPQLSKEQLEAGECGMVNSSKYEIK